MRNGIFGGFFAVQCDDGERIIVESIRQSEMSIVCMENYWQSEC